MKLILALSLITISCSPRCVKSHYEIRIVKEHTEITTVPLGVNIGSGLHIVLIPRHEVRDYICDSYEGK